MVITNDDDGEAGAYFCLVLLMPMPMLMLIVFMLAVVPMIVYG